MAWSDVRPLIKTKLDALGYSEWSDGFFSIENIPETIIDRAYHISLSEITGDRQNQCDQESTLAVELRVIYKGFRYPSEAIDVAIAGSEEIMSALVSPVSRTTTPGILNVIFGNADIAPIDNSNDNAVIVTHLYSVRVITAV